ncbi:LRR receptor-like serine/threonine-protein kinase GSO1 isoform X6 [Gossypium australe]|uniref:LRR receptor-like serine/threonine-protein kinase GSO1 isoform X6 n=1 Tax=Gossypium australe TaxID=47621 RepID=A0A5B6WY84_9ROSI|nr:LRR receptor-like serine/threonine-protein kinase GSO1 isoform X6 [Gossypium australe]
MEYWKLVWAFVLACLFGGYQSEGCWENEKAALFQLKPFFAHIYDVDTSWVEGNCCRWNRVECSTSTGRVTRLVLEYYDEDYKGKFQGWHLNVSLFLPFEELKSLDLSGNYIDGFIDNQGIKRLSKLNKLKLLDLSDTLLGNNILSHLAKFTSLEILFLNNCGLQGSIDILKLDNLKNLKELYLNGNEIESLQCKRQLRLTKLEVLDLSYNYLNSSKFSSLAVLPHLKSLNIENLNVLSNLKILNVSYEGKNNSVPSQGWQNLTNLKELTLTGLSGTSNIIRAFGTLTSLEDLVIHGCDVDDNLNLHGFCELRKLQTLTISNTNWNASLPECFSELTSFNLTSLRELRLSNNSIEIPSSLAPLFNLSKLQNLFADNNLIYNAETEMHSVDTPTFQLRSISLFCCGDGGSFPQFLNHQHDLRNVDLSSINFKGDQFPNWLLENNKKLATLYLANSSLSGHFQLPSTSHRGLLWLDVSSNSLDGNIPNEIGAKLPSLLVLNMSYNFFGGGIPNSIGDMISLQILDFSNNKLSGGIPRHLPMGLLIDVSNNNLSGTIPHCLMNTISNDSSRANDDDSVYNSYVGYFSVDVPIKFTMKSISYFYKATVLTYLSGIDLSCNKLTGEIPHQFQQFLDIIVLNFSHNSLIGPIPLALADLSQIESLDLSYNHLSGNIPSQLLGLHFLSFFSVAYNNLSGTTPQMTGQFGTFEESSYVGNPFLCGEPLPKNCSIDGSSSSMPKNATDKGFIDMEFFYGSFVGSYIVMPLCIAIVLYINPYWRQAWSYHVEAATMSCYYFVLDHILPKRFS